MYPLLADLFRDSWVLKTVWSFWKLNFWLEDTPRSSYFLGCCGGDCAEGEGANESIPFPGDKLCSNLEGDGNCNRANSLQGKKQTLMKLTMCFSMFFTSMVVSLPSCSSTFSVTPYLVAASHVFFPITVDFPWFLRLFSLLAFGSKHPSANRCLSCTGRISITERCDREKPLMSGHQFKVVSCHLPWLDILTLHVCTLDYFPQWISVFFVKPLDHLFFKTPFNSLQSTDPKFRCWKFKLWEQSEGTNSDHWLSHGCWGVDGRTFLGESKKWNEKKGLNIWDSHAKFAIHQLKDLDSWLLNIFSNRSASIC